jgi:tryptophanyl-tRNA synthetase
LKGKFVLSWFELAQSLTVEPKNLIAAYQASSSPGEFHNSIIKLKPPAPQKEKVTSSAVSGRVQAGKEKYDAAQDSGNLFEIHSAPLTSMDEEKSNALEAEISQLKAAISEKDHKIAELQNLLEKSKQDIIIRDEAINSLRKFLGKIRLNLELKTDHAMLFEMVTKEEWVYDKKFGYRKVGNPRSEASE